MISLILPYWNRQEAADKSLKLLAKTYPDIDLEVVIVDDGNIIPFKTPDVALNIKVVRLPLKTDPKSPCVPWNEGVKAANGDIVILSCIEILHEKPVIQEMVKNLKELGQTGYVLASAWCPEQEQWHCHSTVKVPQNPIGTGLSFCAALYKSFYWEAGGYDEDYRDGAGYEDNDFINRMLRVNAKFVIRDDLVVTHPKSGATTHWPSGSFQKNQELFFSKWPGMVVKPVTIVCLKAGTAYSAEYVNILQDMISRNLPAGYPGKFVCITDDPSGLNCETISLPSDLETWWGKLYMFKRGLFADGERCLFMDLDTLIIGALDDIVKYDGKFATLRDFYYPQQIGPAVIAWEAGAFVSSIWDEWVTSGKPRNPMGDLWWLNNLDQGRFSKEIDILQDLYPKQFVSFKADCHPYPPSGARVVCFHGQPKPDNCVEEWVEYVWKIGGSGMTELEVVANTSSETVKNNILSSIQRDITWMDIRPVHERHAVIVGGGESLEDTIKEVHWRVKNGDYIIAINGSARYLNEHGIIPDAQIIIDARPENAKFINTSKSRFHYLASQCDASTFDAAGTDTLLFHMNTDGIENILPKDRKAHLISSGTTVGLAAMVVAYTQGFRTIHLHGFDSSYSEKHHIYDQPENDNDSIVDVVAEGRSFKAAPWMVKQAQQFQEVALQLADNGVTLTVAGDGLIPHIARCMSKGE